MEYNYTREFKQPIKFYTWFGGHSIPLFPDGVRLEYVIVFSGISLVTLLGILASFFFNWNVVTFFTTHYWGLILSGIGLATWILFSLTWDKKSFLGFLTGRVRLQQSKGKQFEHAAKAPLTKGAFSYKKFSQRRKF
ncbi:TcpE family conjugal transfer membrane protein [Enterococcus sp. DIV0660C]|uniref:TcpE family conjugal transfer membrane protein n=1 Tax=Enterococcus sp. DIV0660C TaxID=2230880 RepID=UPI001A8BFE48|nr:TcpE family conjugal transfer membrane protein [Enterococcus sp. DIV0660C]MBO0431282.1 conjugal transfer protein [Enterococcus sp. DIV0660C]